MRHAPVRGRAFPRRVRPRGGTVFRGLQSSEARPPAERSEAVPPAERSEAPPSEAARPREGHWEVAITKKTQKGSTRKPYYADVSYIFMYSFICNGINFNLYSFTVR